MLDFLGLGAGDRVIEIGPGGGALTRELVATGARVEALELDVAWAFRLRAELSPGAGSRFREAASPNPVGLAVADALEVDWARLPEGARVAGNLPYNVGTALLERLLAAAPPGTRSAFLLQSEVVDRIVAEPGSTAYGALSVVVAAHARPARLGRVRPGAFVPPPEVESAFVGLEIVAAPRPAAAMRRFEREVRALFGRRRKTVRNALGALCDREEATRRLESAGIDPTRRPETLSLWEFLALLPEG